MPTYYQILGIKSNANVADIHQAYRHQAKRLHPDLGHADSNQMAELNQAYHVLANPHLRQIYDQTLHSHRPTTTQSQHHTMKAIILWAFGLLLANLCLDLPLHTLLSLPQEVAQTVSQALP